HSWWGKSVRPCYAELLHTPLHVWDPRRQTPAGERHGALVQTIDIGPTLLEFFGVSLTPDMQGRPLGDFVAGRAIREAALFGSHGGHVSVTDGRHVYMRACVDATNSPLHEYTLMPTHMRHLFTPDELRHAQLAGPFGFTKGVPVLRLPGWALGNPHDFGSLLFDLAADPAQEHPLCDDALELRLAELLVAAMRANEAPPDQFERLGLPATGPVTAEHLLVARQWPTVQASSTPPARREDFPPEAAIAATPVAQLLRDDQAGPVLERLLPEVARADVQVLAGHASVLEAAAVLPGIGADRLAAAEAALAAGPQF
ncbi:MAG: hypothetical protein LBH76_04320, partial [Propionibacteriaceae bacterium]|nr:hypothetical protein [Propionibacteriaceae bacterium]